MENQGNMIPPKEQNIAPATGPKEMWIYKIPNKELKIIIFKISMSYKKRRIDN